MCEVNVYLAKKGKEELILKDADLVRVQKDGLKMRNIFGEEKSLKAGIREINLADHKIIIEEVS